MALLAGSASRQAVALEANSPLLLADCAFPAADCCNPACRTALTACCVKNACGLPVAPTVSWKFAPGTSFMCASLSMPTSGGQSKAPTPVRPAPPPPQRPDR
jgi:hypothetical protein